ncbi:MAG TPA: hypothetical protein VF629_21025 [Hymenobacter sp.]|jgi:hypothetical protein|uniref:hypothetical protein n=1 Tax=Hymenobacter sp. TaxID=1898978 RepID=UPI002EDA9CE4
MLSPSYFRLVTLALLASATACSYNPAERPAAGPVAGTVVAASPLQDVRWELREIGG